MQISDARNVSIDSRLPERKSSIKVEKFRNPMTPKKQPSLSQKIETKNPIATNDLEVKSAKKSSDKSFSVSAMMLAARLAKNAKHKRTQSSGSMMDRESVAIEMRPRGKTSTRKSATSSLNPIKEKTSVSSLMTKRSSATELFNRSSSSISTESNTLEELRASQITRSHSKSATSRSPAAQAAAASRNEVEEISQEMRQGHSMPLKDALKGLYRVNRYKTVIGALIWALFVFITYQVLSLVRDTEIVFQQESALEDLFMDEEFQSANFKKNFNDVMTVDELWEWCVHLERYFFLVCFLLSLTH